MNATGSSEIQQALAGALASRPYSHRQDVDPDVAAVITAEEDLRFFPQTMDALLAQRMLPGAIIVVDCSGGTERDVATRFSVIPSPAGPASSVPEAKTVDVQVVGVESAASFGDAVQQGLAKARLGASVRALWLLHDDARPADEHCLARLLDAWRNNPTASLLGAKQLDWEGVHLHDVGSYAGRHRLESLVVDGEEDQEQYDMRQDVFAVSLAGALMPVETLHTLSGVDRWFTTFGESADFCRRVCLSGGRVVVVPSARIAHRRARYEGVRSRAGRAVEGDEAFNTALPVMDCAQRYRYTDTRMALWPLLWVWSVVRGLGMALTQLFSKKPFEAGCELIMPFRALASAPGGVAARRRVARQSHVPLSRLSALSVSRQQMRQWRDRRQALDDQRHTVLLSPLAKAHLRRRRIRRWSGALAMALLAFVVVAVAYRGVLVGALNGGSLYSGRLLPTAASFGQLAQAATTPWVFGAGTGAPAPAAPWLLVWLAVSVLTGGHPVAALALLFFTAAPLMALSMWALAGVFTRSDAVRVAGGLLWVAMAMAMGLFDDANLPMLTVMVFMPAAFAFVFRAVGIYHTEDQLRSHRSVQASALASLCFIPVVAAEPQLLLPLVVIFLAFLTVVPRHRVMLLLMPVPAAFVVAPTLVNAVRYAGDGAWRQLFGDVMVPSGALDGRPASLNLLQTVARAFSLDAGASGLALARGISIVIVLAVLAVLAIVALVLPFALRVSRMMWVVSLCGAALAVCGTRIVVGADVDGDVAASPLPGMSMLLLGLMSCVCLVAGGAVKRFVAVSAPSVPQAAPALEGASPRTAKAAAIRAGRALLVVVLALGMLAVSSTSLLRTDARSVAVSSDGLPMVASDYLAQGADHRILALSATSEHNVEFTVMRTMRGDLLDSSPRHRVRLAFDEGRDNERTLAEAAARLMTGADAQAIEQISALGFGGVFVANGDESESAAIEQLQSNVAACDGTQQVVANDNGTYYRLTINAADQQNIDTGEQRRAQDSRWRYAWLWSAGILTALYCLVALPRRTRRYHQEAA